MPKQTYTISKFTGKMTQEGDPTDLNPGDAYLLENLVVDQQGMLKLDRSKAEVVAGVTKTSISGLVYSYYAWMEPNDGYLVLVYKTMYTGSKAFVGAYYDNSILLTNSLSIEQINNSSATAGTWQAYMPYKNILRIGNDYTGYPASIASWNSRPRFNSLATALDGLVIYSDYTTGGDGEGCGVYPVELYVWGMTASAGGRTSGNYSKHGVALYTESYAASAGYYSAGDVITYGVTFTYDYTQESPMTVIARKDALAIGAGHNAVKTTLWCGKGSASENLLDPRITSINIYRAVNTNEDAGANDFFLLYSVDIQSGLSTGDDASGTAHNWAVADTDYYRLQYIDDIGMQRIESYYDRTGLTQYNFSESTTFPVDVRVKWDFGTIVNGRAVVHAVGYNKNGNVATGDTKTLYVSEIGKPDVFLPDSFLRFGSNDGTDFIDIALLGQDKFVVWDTNNTYIINAASMDPIGWYKEKELALSIRSSAHTVTREGLAFICKDGIYHLSYSGEITEISRPIRTEWRARTSTSGKLIYDSKRNVLYIPGVYTGTYGGYIFDFDSQSLTYWSDDHALNLISQANPFFGFDHSVQLLKSAYSGTSTITIGTISNSTSAIDLQYKSPHIHFGDYAHEKTGKHLFIKYQSGKALTCKIYLDHSATAISLTNLGVSTVPTQVKLDIPYTFRTIQLEISTDSNTGAFELYEWSVEYKPKRAK